MVTSEWTRTGIRAFLLIAAFGAICAWNSGSASDQDPELAWVRQFNSPAPGNGWAYGVAVVDSGVYVVGQGQGSVAGDISVSNGMQSYIRKLALDGSEIWTKPLEFTSFYSYGVAADNQVVCITGNVSDVLPGQTAHGGSDAFLMVFDPDGNELWTRQFGTSSSDYATVVALDSSAIYMAGATQGSFPGFANAGREDVFVTKYDRSGNEIWTVQFGTTLEDLARAIAVDGSGNVHVGGRWEGDYSFYSKDAFVAKLDAGGNTSWLKVIETSSYDSIYGLAVDNGDVYAAGYTLGTLPGQTSSSGYDPFVQKLDSDGNEVWTRQFGTPASDGNRGIAVDASGAYVCGSTYGALGEGSANEGDHGDSYVRKLDASGNTEWTTQFSTLYGGFDRATALGADGSVYVAGTTNGALEGETRIGYTDAFLMKMEPNGDTAWTNQFGTEKNDRAKGVAVVASGIYVTGYTYGDMTGQSNPAYMDAFIRKFDTDGNEIWTRQFGEIHNEDPQAICTDGSFLYVAGATTGFFPGETHAGGLDLFVCKYDLDGNIVWTRQFGTATYERAYAVAVDASGVYVTGTWAANNSRGGRGDAFVRKYDANGSLLWTREYGTDWETDAAGVDVDDSFVFVCGSVTGSLVDPNGPRSPASYVRKYDSDGGELWTFEFSSSSFNTTRAVAADGPSTYVAGWTRGAFPGYTAGNNDIFVAKIVTDAPPVAVAGPDQSISHGQTVYLDGSDSFDDNTSFGNLLYAWQMTEIPAGSTAVLVDADTATPHFVADLVGAYVVELVVTDGAGLPSAPDLVVVSSLNVAPTADAGADGMTFIYNSLALDGTGSFDPEGDSLGYLWTIKSAPEGSQAQITDPSAAEPSFIPDLDGEYVIELTVTDPYDASEPDEVQILVLSNADYIQAMILDALEIVKSLTPEQVTTKGNKQALIRLLLTATSHVGKFNYNQARSHLVNAISRTDGCPLRGGPDGNGQGRDWVLDCDAQCQIYVLLNNAISAMP